MTKNKITLITISLLFFIAFFGTVFFTYNKPHKDFSSAQADITLEAAKLYEHYQNNLSDANLKLSLYTSPSPRDVEESRMPSSA